MDRFFNLNSVLLAGTLFGTIGCGGSDAPTPATDGSQVTAETKPESTMSGTASESNGEVKPAKQLTGGMTLPDDLSPAEPAANEDGPDSPKGLQLPDGL